MADEKVTVVERGGTGGSVAVIVGIVAILAILYVVFGTDMLGGTKKVDPDIKIETPAAK